MIDNPEVAVEIPAPQEQPQPPEGIVLEDLELIAKFRGQDKADEEVCKEIDQAYADWRKRRLVKNKFGGWADWENLPSPGEDAEYDAFVAQSKRLAKLRATKSRCIKYILDQRGKLPKPQLSEETKLIIQGKE